MVHLSRVGSMGKRKREKGEEKEDGRGEAPAFLAENATEAAERANPWKRKMAAAADRTNPLDKYFTEDSLAELVLERTKAHLDALGVTPGTYFDPSAGDGRCGALVRRLWPEVELVQWDVDPLSDEVAQRDFLGSPASTKEAKGWRGPVLGGFNPPFGKNSRAAKEFARLMAPVCDYMVMIIPAKVAITTLTQHYEPIEILFAKEMNALYAAKAGAGAAMFTDMHEHKPRNVDVALFLGRRRDKILSLEEIGHQSTRVDAHSPGSTDLSARKSTDRLVIRARGRSTGRACWILGPPVGAGADGPGGTGMGSASAEAGAADEGGDVVDDSGMRLVEAPGRRKPLKVRRPKFTTPNYVLVGPLSGCPEVDWTCVAHHVVRAPLPAYAATRVEAQGMITNAEAAQMVDWAIDQALAEALDAL